jgi:S1-C subfamily serine protease
MQSAGPHKSRTTLYSIPTDIGIQMARRVQPSVALVTPIGVRNSTARGSGFVIDLVDHGDKDNDNNDCSYIYLLTAAHVASPGTRIEISFSGNNNRRPAAVIGRNITLDLALIRADRFPEDPVGLTISPVTPEVGSLAFAHGYPASRMRGPAMTCGIVCGIADGLGMPDEYLLNGINATDSEDTTSFVVTDAAMSGGMSGGPLVDMEGTVLGVNALIRPDLRALGNYAVSADEIRSFVQTVSLTNTKQLSEDSSTKGYRVILFNDRMNKRTRVAQVLREVAMLNEGEAQKVMMDAHTTGRGLVKQFSVRQNADELCQSLRNEDILVEVE